jgi:hypothetical protein
VYVNDDGREMTGTDAWHCGRSPPARLEPTPKLRVDAGTMLLGRREVAVVDLFTAVLANPRSRHPCLKSVGTWKVPARHRHGTKAAATIPGGLSIKKRHPKRH